MSRGYTTSTLLCFCALSFIFGRFVQEIPGLPQTKSGFTQSGGAASKTSRRQAIEKPVQQAQSHHQSGKPQAPGKKLFTSFEEAVAATEALLRAPPVKPAHTGNEFYSSQPLQIISWYPRIILFPGFIDEQRCAHFVKLAKARLAPSALAMRKTEEDQETEDVRTSQGTFMSRHDDLEGVISWIEEKAAQLTGLPVSHGEPFNVLRYQLGQHYDSHYDIFEPESYGPQSSQRMATILFYLSDVEEGGDTIFPLEGRYGQERLKGTGFNYKSCEGGYRYKPRRGDALMFYSMHPNGTFDKHALHGGCPVIKGEKWVATKWIRDKCFSPPCM
ncbi:g10688 [Coccomyxa viridis]|uniref:G10688 protein n=1 Tax=Coccomyxa viridis TaxID=1274662 RepID=A0ABP1G8K2_9CHLO